MKKVVFLLGFAAFGTIVYFGGIQAIRTVLSPNWPFLLLGFLTTVMVFAISAKRWSVISNAYQGSKVCSFFDYFLYFSSSRFLGQYTSLIVGDLLMRPALLKNQKRVSFGRGFAGVLTDQAFDLFFILFLLLPTLGSLLGWFARWASVPLLIAFVACFALLSFVFPWIRCIDKGVAVMQTIKGRIFRLLGKRNNLEIAPTVVRERSSDILPRKTVVIILLLTIVKYFVLGIRSYCLARALQVDISAFSLFMGLPVAQFSLLLGFTPGGLGALEGGWYAVFHLADVDREGTMAFLIGQRVYQILFVGVIFLAAYSMFGIMKLRRSSSEEEKY